MRIPISAKISAGIVQGLNVDDAYGRAAEEIADKVNASLKRGRKAEETLRTLGVINARDVLARARELGPIDRVTMRIVLTGGHVDSVPKAECVAERLRGKSNPTRQDIEEAFAACAKQ